MMKALLSITLMCLYIPLYAQTQLTIEDAVDQALENNYSIKIARNDLLIDENNFSIGNAGFLPILSANFNRTYGQQSFDQVRSTGDSSFVFADDGVKTLRQSYGAALNWTIFDGMAMFHNHDQLEEFKLQGENELKASIETLLFNLLSTFYSAAFEKERLALFEINVQLSKDRLDIAKDKYELGKASKLEYLQAQVDFNSDRSAMIQQLEALASRKFDLIELMATQRDTVDFELSYALDINKKLKLTELLSNMEQQNQQLMIQRREETIARYNEEINRAERMPSIGLFANYAHQSFDTPSGFAIEGSADDITYGITASWTLFNGFNLNRRIQNSKITSQSAQYTYKQQVIALETDIKQIFLNYKNNLNLLGLEEENLSVAKENNDIAQDRYEIGLSNAIELRESQVNLINAELRYQNAAFAAKLAEIELEFLAGMLVTNQ